ncbi:DNA 3'-5' helicase [Entamoeba marina]
MEDGFDSSEESSFEENILDTIVNITITDPNKPLWICPNGRIIIECDSPLYKEMSAFLGKIAKAVSQMTYIEEYIVSEYSVYSAIAIGLTPEQIITTLTKYSKNVIPKEIINIFEKSTNNHLVKVKCALDGKRTCKCNKEILEFIEKDVKKEGPDLVLITNIINFKQKCKKQNILVIEEVEMGKGKGAIDIKLRDEGIIRDYQQSAISSVFGSGHARCGMIVLPCGSGKTLTAIACICTMKERAIIVCTSVESVEQWRNEIRKWSTIPLTRICCFTSVSKESVTGSWVVITTYQMLSSKDINGIDKELFGLMILDEVHTSAADGFRSVYPLVQARCRVGLTGSLVREDNKIVDLDYLTGPLLFQQSWQKLMTDGYLAEIKCFEIKCPMTKLFYEAYITTKYHRHRNLLIALNPFKIAVTKFLVEYHKKRREKVIVFCDTIIALREYSKRLECKMFSGETPNKDRFEILRDFRLGDIQCVAMSCVGDNSLDIPDASVIIQVSTHHGSRRQQTQRLGRISRVKQEKNKGFFYSLTSVDTSEEKFASKRQMYLQNIGFGFEIIPGLDVTVMREGDQQRLIERTISDSDTRFFNKHNKEKKESRNVSKFFPKKQDKGGGI